MRSRLLALTAAASLALAACGGGAATTPPAQPTTAPEPTSPAAGASGGLAGTSWVGSKADPSSPANPTKITLAFENGALSGTGGCNRLGGSYQVVAGVMSVGPMMSTEMACEEPLMAQDQWLAALLNGARVTVTDSTLILANGENTLTLTDTATANPPVQLDGTTWVLTGISDGSTASSVPAGVTASITIKDGQAQVAFGCNTGGGNVTVADGTLTFGLLASTLMLCEGPAGAVETVMTGVLQGVVPFAIEGDRLTLTGTNGTTLTFGARPA